MATTANANAATVKWIRNTEIADQIINGSDETVVQTSGGPVSSLAKKVKDLGIEFEAGVGGIFDTVVGGYAIEAKDARTEAVAANDLAQKTIPKFNAIATADPVEGSEWIAENGRKYIWLITSGHGQWVETGAVVAVGADTTVTAIEAANTAVAAAEAAEETLGSTVKKPELLASGGADMVGFDGDTVSNRISYSTRVQWVQSPDISDTVIARKKTAGATKLHIEPNGWIDAGTTAKLDLMGDSLAAVGDLTSYRIGNFWFNSDNPRGANGSFNMNVKGRGNQFGIWPEWQFGFQDVASNAVCMKLYFFDTSDSAWRTPMKGMIRTGKAIVAGDFGLYANKLYQAGTTGNCGATPPTHAAGTVSDGTIDWTFVRDFSASSGSIKPLVFIGDQADMPIFGFPNSRLQVATQQVVHNNRKISFVDIDGTVSYEIYSRASDGKLVIGSPDGTKYMLFDKSSDVTLAGMSFAPRVLSLAGTQTTADVSNIEILRLAQASPQLITAITGKGYNPFRVFGSLAGTTLRNGVNLALLSGEDYVVGAGEVLQFMTNSTGGGVYEVGTTYRPKYAAPGNAAFTTKPAPHCTVTYKLPITADRAVTLNATNPRAGEVVRVVRTAAATGAFNVNVAHSLGTKALAAGANATFVYDGAAWELVDSGAV